MNLPVRLLDPDVNLPKRAYAGDAGLDLEAAEKAVIGPLERKTIRIGLAVEIPEGHVGLILPRSGYASKYGITHLDAPGVIDSGYRGEVHFILYNTDKENAFAVNPRDRVGQLLIVPFAALEPVAATALSSTDRGSRGLGSSNRDGR